MRCTIELKSYFFLCCAIEYGWMDVIQYYSDLNFKSHTDDGNDYCLLQLAFHQYADEPTNAIRIQNY